MKSLGLALSTLWLLGCTAAPDDTAGRPTPAAGQGPKVGLDGRTSACDLSPQNLRIVGGDAVLLPSCSQPLNGSALGINGRHVMFANFEGVDVRLGDLSLENQAIRGDMTLDVISTAPYDGSNPSRYDKILQIQKQVAAWYADFNIDVVISRPLSGDYLMTGVGDHEATLGYPVGVLGISPADCHNGTEADMDWAFSASTMPSEDPVQTAITLAHESGHAWGLGHTLGTDDIMYPVVMPGFPTGFTGGEVADAGPCNLPPGSYQNSHQWLIENLGARSPELDPPGKSPPPTVRILSPADQITVGSEVTIAVAAQSQARGGIDHVTLSIGAQDGGVFRGNHPVAELRPPTSAVQIRMSVPGNYQLTATAYDGFGNVALAHSQFAVATITCSVPNDCAPGQTCTNNTCTTPPLPATPPTGDPNMGLRAYGSACTQSSECVGGICAPTPIGQICTHYCNPSRACAGFLSCIDGICQPDIHPRSAPSLGQLGAMCNSDEDCFLGDQCSPLVDPTTPRYCTHTCDPTLAWSCPANMTCTMSNAANANMPLCLTPAEAQAAGGGGGCQLGGPLGRSAGGTSTGVLLFLLGLSLGLIGLRRRGFRMYS